MHYLVSVCLIASKGPYRHLAGGTGYSAGGTGYSGALVHKSLHVVAQQVSCTSSISVKLRARRSASRASDVCRRPSWA
jgi:hypothetical protein